MSDTSDEKAIKATVASSKNVDGLFDFFEDSDDGSDTATVTKQVLVLVCDVDKLKREQVTTKEHLANVDENADALEGAHVTLRDENQELLELVDSLGEENQELRELVDTLRVLVDTLRDENKEEIRKLVDTLRDENKEEIRKVVDTLRDELRKSIYATVKGMINKTNA
jgi:ABC-type transporter Mla subunit MlaD